jgi:hypothetical protein
LIPVYQVAGDLAVGQALRHQLEDLALAGGEVLECPCLRQRWYRLAGQALAGDDRGGLLRTPWVAAVLLLVYAAVTLTAATLATSRRDVA